MIAVLLKVWLNIAKLSYRAAEQESWVQRGQNGKKKLIPYAEHIMPKGLQQQFWLKKWKKEINNYFRPPDDRCIIESMAQHC